MEYRNGVVNDRRKHFEQMSEEEVSAVLRKVRSKVYKLGSHAMERMKTRHINETQVLQMIGYAKVVEVHNNIPNEYRVLLRGKVAGTYICTAVSLTTETVVTTYRNEINDHHATLDKSLYKWEVDLVKLMEEID